MSYAIALVSSFISFLCFFLCCTAIDTLTPTQPIKDGQTLISANKYFELGFFSPGLSKNRYIGIWFHNISTKTVVWVANREHPVTDSSGVLSINRDGNLVILDGRGRPVWSSIAFIILKNTTATLLESGNLVLRESGSDGNNNYLWQSFNHRTDSLLPTMELSVNRRTGEKKDVTSWRSKDDPAPGNYVFGLEAQVIPQLFVWNGSTPYWRSGQWNGRIFVGIPNMFNAYINGPTLVEKNGIVYYAHSYNTEEYLRIWLDWKGMLSQEIWNEKTKEWHSTWVHSHNPCHLYNTCGPFGICKERESSICSCMRGFKPKFADEWRKGNWTGGCVRRVELNCDGHGSGPADKAGRGDGFLKFEGVKMPDFVGLVHNVDADMCEDECLNNCSCVAYAHVRGIGCMIWSGDLIDIQEFVDGGEDLHIRLADSELGRKGSVKPLIIASSVFGAVIMACCAFIICRRMARKRETGDQRKEPEILLFDIENSRDSSDVSMLHDGRKQSNGLKFPMFDFNQIVAATRNFDQTNKIGEGGFGPVYKGLLPEGQEVAVKRLSKFSGQGLEEFKNEIMLISELQHRNLVRLLGACIEGDEKLLVYEYMPNKSLDAFLFDPKRKVMLDWGRRFNIVGEIARGILYLHRDSRLRIIHRDLKASNILLDAELNPKISDFGMARIFGHNQILARTNRVVGTYGYMSPEYAMGGRFSEKSDVFSFGVLLLEIVSGKRSTGFYEPEHSSSLLGCVWRLWNEGNLLKIIDHALGDSFSEAEVQRCIHVALLCVQESAADRPTMLSVIFMLGSDTATLPIPKQPAFTESSSAAETDLLRKNREICSVNEVTVTMLHGR